VVKVSGSGGVGGWVEWRWGEVWGGSVKGWWWCGREGGCVMGRREEWEEDWSGWRAEEGLECV